MISKNYLTAAKDLEKNPGQWEAYGSTGNAVILAGPGSGKTKTISIKVAKILSEEVRAPRGIACLTYNSESVRELKRRFLILGISESSRLYIGTIHSFCLKHLLIPFASLAGLDLPQPIQVADSNQQEEFLRESLIEMGQEPGAYYSIKPRFEKYRRTHLDRNAASWHDDNPQMADLIDEYEKRLRANGLIDFDDMIIFGHYLLENHGWVRKVVEAKFPVFVIDEYQDLGTALHQIVLTLAFQNNVRIIAVGDIDQSIYDFTGANPDLLTELANHEDVETIRLRLNYRNGKNIVASSLLILNEQREYEAAQDYDGSIEIIHARGGIEEQAEIVCTQIIPQSIAKLEGRRLGDLAVLYPDFNEASAITRAARKHGLKYIGGDKQLRYDSSALTQWLEECAAWCSGGWRNATPRLSTLLYFWASNAENGRRFSVRGELRIHLMRFLWTNRDPDLLLKEWLDNFMTPEIISALETDRSRPGEKGSLLSLYAAASDVNRMGDMTVGDFGKLRGASDHLNLVTLHSSKGLEFDTVIMIGLENGKIPDFRATTEELRKEQRRLFYVGLTRARHDVYLLSSGWYSNRWGRRFNTGPSDFLTEVEKNLAYSSA